MFCPIERKSGMKGVDIVNVLQLRVGMSGFAGDFMGHQQFPGEYEVGKR